MRGPASITDAGPLMFKFRCLSGSFPLAANGCRSAQTSQVLEGVLAALGQLHCDVTAGDLSGGGQGVAGGHCRAPTSVPSGDAQGPGTTAETEPAAHVPYCWRRVSAAEARGLWVRLREWVDWVNGRYFASSGESIRLCWFRHPAAVEELTALWAAWESAYRASDEGEGFSDAALWWHEKLHAVVHRLWDEQFAECKAGHQEPDVYERVTDSSFDEFLQHS